MTVWVKSDVLRHSTVSPVWTVTVAGSKAKVLVAVTRAATSLGGGA
jgi:hypothetical protein